MPKLRMRPYSSTIVCLFIYSLAFHTSCSKDTAIRSGSKKEEKSSDQGGNAQSGQQQNPNSDQNPQTPQQNQNSQPSNPNQDQQSPNDSNIDKIGQQDTPPPQEEPKQPEPQPQPDPEKPKPQPKPEPKPEPEKKPEPKPEVKPQPRPEQRPPSVRPESTPPRSQEELKPLPKPPEMGWHPVPVLQPQTLHDGSVKFAVLGILNQDTKHQITNDGYRVQLRTNAGELLVSAPLNSYALLRGEAADANQQNVLAQPFVLNAQPKYLAPKVVSGELSGSQTLKMDVCLPQNPQAPFDQYAPCAKIANQGHANGINHFTGATATVEFAGMDVSVKSITGTPSYGSCGNTRGMPCVAIGHAATAAYAMYVGEKGDDRGSPLVLNFAKSGAMNLISAWDQKHEVKFDLSASGEAIRTGWIGRDAGLLALDINNDGMINSGHELFGEYSALRGPLKASDALGKSFENGFAALAQYAAARKTQIDETDAIYSQLRVWFDRNLSGVSEAGELVTLAELGVTSIDLGYQVVAESKKSVAGNRVEISSTFTTKDGKKHEIADVYFSVRTHRSVAEILNDKQNAVDAAN